MSFKFVPPTNNDPVACIVGAVILPVISAPVKLALKVIAGETALDMRKSLGRVLATFPNPSVVALIDETSPELRKVYSVRITFKMSPT